MNTTETMNTTEITVKMMLDRWNSAIKSFDTSLNAMTDEQLQKEIAPGKNRGIYLLGHLIAVHDLMLPLLDMGDKKYPELTKIFLEEADKTVTEIPTAQELRNIWNDQCKMLSQKFESLSPESWFEKHTAVSAEDFVREPHRCKLNILLTRTTHLTYHTGQFIMLK